MRFLILFLLCIAITAVTAVTASANTSKPVALIGTRGAIASFRKEVTEPIGLVASEYRDAAPGVDQYKNYQAVIFLEHFPSQHADEDSVWETPDRRAKVKSYLEGGGKIIILITAFPRSPLDSSKAYRDLTPLADLLGFSRNRNGRDLKNPIRVQPAGEDLFPRGQTEFDFLNPTAITIGGVTTAQILATVTNNDGKEFPFATLHPVGSGRLYWFGTSPFRLRMAVGSEHPTIEQYITVLQKALTTP